MRLLRASEVETSPSDLVFSYSRARALLFVAVVLGTATWLVFHAVTTNWKPGYYIAAVILSFLELLRRFITARFRPSNWLVRMDEFGFFVQFRSYLNYHLPAGDITVVFLSYGEIRSARLVRERVTVPSSEGRTETQFNRYVELELAGDTEPLAKALDAELAEKAPAEKRWYGRSSTLYQDHPVRMTTPTFLRIHWQVVPRPQRFLDVLRPYALIADPVSITPDLAHLDTLSREEQQKRLRDLAERGQTIAAIYAARKLYGGSLAEAKQMVEGLAGKSSARV